MRKNNDLLYKRFLKNIFLSIANKLGFQLQSKVDTSNDFHEVNDVSMTSTIAENLSTMIIADSTINVKGNRVEVMALGILLLGVVLLDIVTSYIFIKIYERKNIKDILKGN